MTPSKKMSKRNKIIAWSIGGFLFCYLVVPLFIGLGIGFYDMAKCRINHMNDGDKSSASESASRSAQD